MVFFHTTGAVIRFNLFRGLDLDPGFDLNRGFGIDRSFDLNRGFDLDRSSGLLPNRSLLIDEFVLSSTYGYTVLDIKFWV
jgi:hypothetical protein